MLCRVFEGKKKTKKGQREIKTPRGRGGDRLRERKKETDAEIAKKVLRAKDR